MDIKCSKKAEKYLDKLDTDSKMRIKDGIEELPFGDVRRIVGSNAFYRLRVGDCRVIFSYLNKEHTKIFIEKIAPRGQVYKEM